MPTPGSGPWLCQECFSGEVRVSCCGRVPSLPGPLHAPIPCGQCTSTAYDAPCCNEPCIASDFLCAGHASWGECVCALQNLQLGVCVLVGVPAAGLGCGFEFCGFPWSSTPTPHQFWRPLCISAPVVQRVCYACHATTPAGDPSVRKCSASTCGKFYHMACARTMPLSRIEGERLYCPVRAHNNPHPDPALPV